MDLKEIEDGTLKENTKHFQEQFGEQRVKDASSGLNLSKRYPSEVWPISNKRV